MTTLFCVYHEFLFALHNFIVLCFVGTGISRLIGLIRSQQQTWQQHRQQLRQGSPELRLDKDPPLSLSISTVTNRLLYTVHV